MPKAGMRVKGAKELERKLRRLSSKSAAKRILRRAAQKAIRPIVKAAKRNVDSETGTLKKSLTHKVTWSGYNVNAIAGADKEAEGPDGRKPHKYDHLVEYGHTTPEGQIVPANPFLRPAWDSNISTSQATFTSELAEGIEKEAAK